MLHPPPMLMPPPCGIAVLDAMTLLPVIVGIMFAISDAPVIAAEATEVIMLWSMIETFGVTGGGKLCCQRAVQVENAGASVSLRIGMLEPW